MSRHPRFAALRAFAFARQSWKKLRYPALRRTDQGRTEFYARMWKSVASKLGAEFIELRDGFFEVRLNGRVTRLHQGLVMLDDPVTLKLAGNKPLVHAMLSEVGLSVPAHRVFALATIRDAEEFLRSHNGPYVVKPALDSGGGDGVTSNIRTAKDLRRAAVAASLHGSSLMIEQQISGESYRLLYLRGRLIHALHRRSPRVTGDGKSSVRKLVVAENVRRATMQSSTVTRLQMDVDMRMTLHNAGLSLGSVPAKGRDVVVKTVVNDNSRNDNISVTGQIGEALRVEGALAASVLGVELAAVDIITGDPDVSLKQAGGAIIEVNTTPGLHHHYNVNNPEEGGDVAAPILKFLLGMENW